MSLKQTIHQMFKQSITHPRWRLSDFSITTIPSVNIQEATHGYQIKVHLPDIKAEHITLTAEENHLSIQTTRNEEKENDREGLWHIHESRHGSYECTITFTKPVDTTKVTSAFAHSILTIDIPWGKSDGKSSNYARA